MKKSLLASALIVTFATVASAQDLLLNFYSTSSNGAASGPVSDPYLALSPAHVVGGLAGTSWNNLNSASGSSSLVSSNGTSATGVSITFGLELVAGDGIIDFTFGDAINVGALYGSGGGTPGQQSLVGDPLSIYGEGNNSLNSAPARAGWLGTGSAGSTGTAIGMRVDGLAAGVYTIYVMGRNTNGNAVATPMDFFAATGPGSEAFNFSELVGTRAENPVFPDTNPMAYNAFIEGENYVAIQVTIGEGESLFLASDGASSSETRGFLNLVEIVAVPEPGTWALLGLGGLALFGIRSVRPRQA